MDGHLPHFSLQFIFYNQEWLILETIYVVNKEILQKNPRERVIMARVRYNIKLVYVLTLYEPGQKMGPNQTPWSWSTAILSGMDPSTSKIIGQFV